MIESVAVSFLCMYSLCEYFVFTCTPDLRGASNLSIPWRPCQDWLVSIGYPPYCIVNRLLWYSTTFSQHCPLHLPSLPSLLFLPFLSYPSIYCYPLSTLTFANAPLFSSLLAAVSRFWFTNISSATTSKWDHSVAINTSPIIKTTSPQSLSILSILALHYNLSTIITLYAYSTLYSTSFNLFYFQKILSSYT